MPPSVSTAHAVAVATRRAASRTRECSYTSAPRSISRAPQPERQPGRVERGEVGHHHAAAEHGRVAAGAHARLRRARPPARALPAPRRPRRPRAPTSSKPGAVDTHMYPDWSNQASTSLARHQSPIAPTVCARGVEQLARRGVAEALAERRPRSARATRRTRRCARWDRGRRRPPSSSATRAPGSASSRCHAVHRPVKPPPITTTSASTSPFRAALGVGSPASSSHQPPAVCRSIRIPDVYLDGRLRWPRHSS